ncbi:MAG: LysM peptidoglycan-binding domain-containing protein [Bacteriovoracia bacterium]
MRKESKVLILSAILLANAGAVIAQEDLVDEDLQTLLQDETPPVQEVSEVTETPAETPTETTTEATTEATTEGTVSSETVDLNALEVATDSEFTADTPGETAVTEDIPETSVETVVTEETDSIEAIDSGVPETTVSETADDLESIKEDTGGEVATTPEATPTTVPSTAEAEPEVKEPTVFDVGREERELLSLAQNIQGQITDPEWSEVATAAKVDTYTVVPNDWLFKISKKLFGSGFYYPKIWSLNSFITNPHFIEPGMVLSFTTGSASAAPEVRLGTFTAEELQGLPGQDRPKDAGNLANFGDGAEPPWIDEKSDLEKQGVYFQYASEETMEDLQRESALALNREYESYEPPKNEFDVILPKNYDKSGFDKNSRIFYSFKEGFYLSTFVSTNIVQDFGSITNGADENLFFTVHDRAYVQFDETINVIPGDKFSIYSSGGRVKHPNSDRQGYKYSIIAQIRVIKKIRDKWEIEFTEVMGVPQRGDRITAYTPKIESITKTYNPRLVEAAVMAGYEPGQNILSYGDVVYLDRGRADGLEMGNVLELYGFKDRATNENITDQPTYKLGELTVITLTDNFATALVSKSNRDFYPGDIAITKTKEAYLREIQARRAKFNGDKEILGGKALEELDVELNLENLNEDLLEKADKIQLTEDELAELERQERERSLIKDSEKDLKALERLENEIEAAEGILNEAKLDEDKLLEETNLNELERKSKMIGDESLDEIEENLGKRYVEEDLNTKENPFGLTEFDIEEVDELLNIEKKE